MNEYETLTNVYVFTIQYGLSMCDIYVLENVKEFLLEPADLRLFNGPVLKQRSVFNNAMGRSQYEVER